jgi:hypothetical protein
VPVLDSVACGDKLLEGLFDYGLATSRVTAFRPPEEKEHLLGRSRPPLADDGLCRDQ